MFITLNYHIWAIFHTISALKFSFQEFWKENFNAKLIFDSFHIKNYFSYKNAIPDDLKSFLIYNFFRASCSSSFAGETCRYFKTRIEENIKNDNHVTDFIITM